MTFVIAIDNGANGGIAYGANGYTERVLPRDSRVERLCLALDLLDEEGEGATAEKSVQVYLEQPWGGRGASGLRQQMGHWLEACRYVGIPDAHVHLVYPVQWQSKLLPRKCKDTKAAAMAVAQALGASSGTHDEADARCILEWALTYAEPARLLGVPLVRALRSKKRPTPRKKSRPRAKRSAKSATRAQRAPASK